MENYNMEMTRKEILEKINKKETEPLEDYLWRLGSLKDHGFLSLTWPQLTDLLNSEVSEDEQHTESYWRKRYRQMCLNRASKEAQETSEDIQKNLPMMSVLTHIEKQRVRTRDERTAYSKFIREQARREDMFAMLQDSIEKLQPVPPVEVRRSNSRSVYALLSDIHYGIAFTAYENSYDSEIAKQRVMTYAAEIIRIGREQNAANCYVSLLGDLISGNIHSSIRVENRENLIQQVTGVSELVASFLYELAKNFDTVIVNSVDGNHSRVEASFEDALREERLDSLIPWYCKTRLSQVKNVQFNDQNVIDPTIASFEIYGKFYVAVHGDMDSDLKQSVQRIERKSGCVVDCIIAGHMHVAEARFEDVSYIRNGCVCGSGDEYTAKKRLSGPATQVCLVVDHTGVIAYYPITL